MLFRATIWPLKISFPGCALKQETSENKEGGRGKMWSWLRRTLSFVAQSPTIFIKFLFNVSTGKLKMYVNKWDKRVWCWNAHGRGNGAYLRADPSRISSLSSYPWILTPVYVYQPLILTYSPLITKWSSESNIWNDRPRHSFHNVRAISLDPHVCEQATG